MTLGTRVRVAVVLVVVACGLLPACASTPHGPTYTDVELEAICWREGGWWRGNLIPGYCEPSGATLP